MPLEPFFAPLPAPTPPARSGSPSSNGFSVRQDPFGLFTISEFIAEERTLFPFSAHPLVGRMTPGGAGAGLSERQQARLSARWSWDLFLQLVKQEGL